MSDAYLSEVDYYSATLTGITSGNITGTSTDLPDNWKIANGYLIGPGAYLRGADLTDADLTDTTLSNATLTGACMKSANVDNTSFNTHTRVYNATLSISRGHIRKASGYWTTRLRFMNLSTIQMIVFICSICIEIFICYVLWLLAYTNSF